MSTLSVGAVDYDASDSCFEELDDVLLQGWGIDLVVGGEEGEGGDVDAVAES